MQARSIVLVAQALNGGGAEMCMLRLAQEFRDGGHRVRLALLNRSGRLLDMVPEGIAVDEIGGGRLTCIWHLSRYLAKQRPDAIFGFMTYANIVAMLAQLLSPSLTKIIVSEHNAYSRSIKIRGGLPKLFHQAVPVAYRWARTVICVSRGVEDDLAAATGLPRRLLTTIYNPVITADLLARSHEPPGHPWLSDKTVPVVVAVGRLEKQKNYPLLLAAFARLRARRGCRLVVLGEGTLLGALKAEAERLGISQDVDFAGFRDDAPACMRQADLFVLSSDFEGLSNVLIEAMAVGCPVVSTDAPHGPREVLRDGQLGRLVPTGEASSLAAAMEAALADPGDPEPRRAWAATFNARESAERYLRAAGLRLLPVRAAVVAPAADAVRVSVIIAAFNVRGLIMRAIDSVRAQTYGDWEIVVVDDASGDGTAEFVAGLADADPRIRLLRQEQNRGPAAARNRGIDTARGTFVAVLDADDAWNPERLERLLAIADAERSDYVADNLILYDDRAETETGVAFDLGEGTAPFTSARLFAHGNPWEFGIVKPLIRRAFLAETGLRYDENLRFGEDFLLQAELLFNGARGVLTSAAYYVYTTPVGHQSRQRAAGTRSNTSLESLLWITDTLSERYRPLITRDIAAGLARCRRRSQRRLVAREITRLRQERRFRRLIAFLAAHPRGAVRYLLTSRSWKTRFGGNLALT